MSKTLVAEQNEKDSTLEQEEKTSCSCKLIEKVEVMIDDLIFSYTLKRFLFLGRCADISFSFESIRI